MASFRERGGATRSSALRRNVRPLAQQFNRVLVRLLDGTGRFAVVTLTDLDRRATPPDPHTTFHDDLDAALRAGGT